MEKFIVSARKYRPVTFDTVVGQPGITQTLKNAVRSNHLAQAFLFTGPRGTGKTSTARILAKSLRCGQALDFVPCGACSDCEDKLADAQSTLSKSMVRATTASMRFASFAKASATCHRAVNTRSTSLMKFTCCPEVRSTRF